MWINVKNSLPTIGGSVLVVIKSPKGAYDRVHERYYDEMDGRFYYTPLNLDITDVVTHWMPLPGPPTEKQD